MNTGRLCTAIQSIDSDVSRVIHRYKYIKEFHSEVSISGPVALETVFIVMTSVHDAVIDRIKEY